MICELTPTQTLANRLCCPNILPALTLILILNSTFPIQVLANASGTCVEGSNGDCAMENADCTIVLKGRNIAGKCTTEKATAHYCFCAVDGKQEESDVNASANGPIPTAPARITFALTPHGPGVASLPLGLGGNAVNYSSFSGSVTMQSQPTGDPNVDRIYIVNGTITQNSLTLPNGQATGIITFTFVPQISVSGTLNRGTGQFSFSADGRITSNLFGSSAPILTQGDYFGTVNMATGVATVDTRTFDTYPNSVVPALSW